MRKNHKQKWVQDASNYLHRKYTQAELLRMLPAALYETQRLLRVNADLGREVLHADWEMQQEVDKLKRDNAALRLQLETLKKEQFTESAHLAATAAIIVSSGFSFRCPSGHSLAPIEAAKQLTDWAEHPEALGLDS